MFTISNRWLLTCKNLAIIRPLQNFLQTLSVYKNLQFWKPFQILCGRFHKTFYGNITILAHLKNQMCIECSCELVHILAPKSSQVQKLVLHRCLLYLSVLNLLHTFVLHHLLICRFLVYQNPSLAAPHFKLNIYCK